MYGVLIEIFKTIFSWPTAIFLIVILFIKNFKPQISMFIDRMTSLHFPGGKTEAIDPIEYQKNINTERVEDYNEEDSDLLDRIKDNPKQFIEEFREITKGYIFERGFTNIFGSQIRLLEHLQEKAAKGDKIVNLLTYYNEFIKSLGIDGESSTYQPTDYLNFLHAYKFIVYSGEDIDKTAIITSLGVEFLSYINKNYSEAYKKKLF